MKISINIKTQNVLDQIDNLTTTYSPWIFCYEKIGKSWIFTYENEDCKKRTKKVSFAHLEKGMAKLAEEAPARFGNIVTGDSDALDADAFVQCAIFGKLVYA